MEPMEEVKPRSDREEQDELETGRLVRRQAADPRAFEVQLPGESEPQVAEQNRLSDGTLQLYCTCQENVSEESASPECGHLEALRAFLDEVRQAAAGRQARGIRYGGIRTPLGCQVFVWEGEEARPLPPRHDLRNHSPDGFEWSYAGSGPAQLALAMLADFTGDDGLALDCYQAFKQAVIARLPREEGRWEVGAGRIRRFLSLRQPGRPTD